MLQHVIGPSAHGENDGDVYVEARPKGSPEGSRIADYVVEERGQSSEPSRHRKRRSMGRKGRDIHRWLRASAI